MKMNWKVLMLTVIMVGFVAVPYSNAKACTYNCCEKGDKGDQGPAGKDGKDGKNGLNGKDGATGAQGVKGDKGDKGNDGVNGIDGKDGLQGEAGINGIDGTDGKDGVIPEADLKQISTNTKNIENNSNRLDELEATQYVVEGNVRIQDSRKWQTGVFARYNCNRNMVDTVGVRFTYKIGQSYEEQLLEEQLERIKELEEKLAK